MFIITTSPSTFRQFTLSLALSREEKEMKSLFTINLLILFNTNIFCQKVIFDSVDCEKFWTSCIIPIINLDTIKLKQIVHFPVSLDWHGVKSKKYFFENLDAIFFPELITRLKEMSCVDFSTQSQHGENGNIKLSVVMPFKPQEKREFRPQKILHFKKVKGKWILYGILNPRDN
jgi:hypothetical protein